MIGFKLRHYRITYRLTQEDAARAIGISTPTLDKLEKGRGVKKPRPFVIRKIEEFFQTRFMPSDCRGCKFFRTTRFTGYMDAPDDDMASAIFEYKKPCCYYAGILENGYKRLCDRFEGIDRTKGD